MLTLPRTPGATAHPVSDLDEAIDLVERSYLPHCLDLSGSAEPLAMRMRGVRLRSLTAARLTYGRAVGLRTVAAEEFHVNLPLSGTASSRTGRSEVVTAGVGDGAVFSPGLPASIEWSETSEQLCLMVPRTTLESALAGLLEDTPSAPLRLDFALDLRPEHARRWRAVVEVLLHEIDSAELGAAPVDLPALDRHLEALVVDGLLLAQHHNHSERLDRRGARVAAPTVQAAVDRLEDRPAEPWSTVALAAEVHVSARALQEGFSRDIGIPPMAYLRQVRLRRVRELLEAATPETTTVRAAATALGLVHLGRFAATYRETYGESPSETLRRR